MNIRDFEHIIAVDELKSFIKASKKCFVSQPALSMQIQKVEDVLGIKIFERTRKSIITTKEGEKVIEYAKLILQNFDVIKSIKNDVKNLRIGLIYTVSPYLIPKIIQNIQKHLNDISIVFTEGKTKDLINDLNQGKIDGVIVASSEFCNPKKNLPSSNIEVIPLYKEKFFLTLPKNYHIKINNDLMQKSEFKELLKKENFVLLEEGHCMAENVEEICAHYNVKLSGEKATIFTSSIETIKEIVRQGNGISLLPMLSIKETDDLNYYEMPSGESRLISLFFRRNSSKIHAIGQLSAIIKHSI
jgi:LysR family hydrogen peroxide-inducible transcriptional activator